MRFEGALLCSCTTCDQPRRAHSSVIVTGALENQSCCVTSIFVCEELICPQPSISNSEQEECLFHECVSRIINITTILHAHVERCCYKPTMKRTLIVALGKSLKYMPLRCNVSESF